MNRTPAVTLPIVGAMFLTIAVLQISLPPSSLASGPPDEGSPNIVLINLDDADAGLLAPRMLDTYYPHIRRLANSGISFSNMHVTSPFCSASRAALMTGKYGYRNQVKVNDPLNPFSNGFSGGYGAFLAEGHDTHELGTWMKAAGYRTMQVGKYHHHDFDFRVPPGWDEFHITLGARYFGTYRFTNRDTPEGEMTQTGIDDYITDVDAADAERLIRSQAELPVARPFFLYVAPIAPHYPEAPTPTAMVDYRKYADFAAGEAIPPDPDWNEADFTDKPLSLRVPLMSDWELDWFQEEYISRVRAIKSVDDLVGRIFAALEETGQLENTFLILTSDNGYQLGHHRTAYKLDPFDRTTRVPLFVRGPGVPPGKTASFLLAHLDLCPTLLELAGIAPPADLDGRSFVPLLKDPDAFDPEGWQRAIMIENWQTKTLFGRTQPATYTALRFFDSVYVAWANGAREYYDLASDPFQLNNLYPVLPETVRQGLAEELRSFRVEPILPRATIREETTVEATAGYLSVDGFAEDNSGIDRVRLVVWSFFTGLYYNGFGWQMERASIDVAPASPDSPISSWDHIALLEPPAGLTIDYLVITARPFDDSGDYPREVVWTVRPLDVASPEAFFNNPLPEYVESSGPIRFEGGIRDEFLVDRVRFVVRNQDSGQYFDGIQWQDGWTFINAELTGPLTWQCEVPLAAGRYVASVRAVDSAGNWQVAPDVIRFRVSSEPP